MSFFSFQAPCRALSPWRGGRVLLLAALGWFLSSCIPGAHAGPVHLNEVCAANRGGAISPGGTTPDYIELHNTNAVAMSLAGWSLSDNPDRPDKYVFPASASIPGHGFLVVWLDDLPYYAYATTNFTLKSSGETLGLYQGGNLIDQVTFGPQLENLPLVRVPDGTGSWHLGHPSPGVTNLSLAATNFGTVRALRLNEWLATNSLGAAFDWLEVYNPSTNRIVDASGLVISDVVTDITTPSLRPLSFIAPGDRYQFWCDGSTNDGNHLAIKLSSTTGETLTLYTPDRATIIDRVTFGPQSGDVSMGRLPDGSTNIVYFVGTNNLTPGKANPWQALTNLVINEVLTATAPPLEDAIELWNPTPVPLDISHWYLSDSEEFPLKFRIPAGTVLPAFGFKVFYEQNQANGSSSTAGFNRSGTGVAPDFNLDAIHGADVVLTEGLASGVVTGRREVKTVESASAGVSFGRHVKSDGGSDLVLMAARTFGADSPSSVSAFRLGTGKSNAYPMVGPLVLTEIQYRPPDIGTNDNTIDEFVELRSTTNGTLRLYDPNYPTNVWRIRGGIEYDFPTNQSLAAASRLLLVNFNPVTNTTQLAAFRALYSVPTNVPIYGPYLGKLNNSKDTLEIQRPDAVQLPPKPDAGFVPRIIVERLKYEDAMGWTTLAEGTGLSLQRLSLSGYGNDHTNWYAAPPTAGTSNAPGVGPAITSPPASLVTTQGLDVTFRVTATGSAPLHYLWLKQDTNLAGSTTSNLTLLHVQPADAGSYRVWVTNYFGAVTSAVANLTVYQPPIISTQPGSLLLPAGAQAVFSVAASGTAPFTYQWRKSGGNLAGQTNASLILNNIQPAHAGGYDAVIRNVAGSVTSQVATLTVGGVAPAFTQQPASQLAAAGTTVTLTVAASGLPAPGFFWRYNGSPLAGATNASLVLPNVHPLESGQYDVLASNSFGSVLSAPATVTIGQPPMILLPPADQTVDEGGDVMLLVVADGTPTLQYQWRCQGTNLPGENSPILSLHGIQASQAGAYTLLVSNDFGSVLSDPIRVSVVAPPRLVMGPMRSNGAVLLTLHGSVGLTYEIEAAEGLGTPTWTLLRRFILTNELGVEALLDDGATNRARRFYRGKLVQP